MSGQNTEELKQLWQDVFGDSREYIDSFFDAFYDPQLTIVFRAQGEIISALYLIPYQYKYFSSLKTAYYLYALATRQEYRGRKIMSGLISQAMELAEKKGADALFLVPAQESLIHYYKQFGFQTAGYQTTVMARGAELLVSWNAEDKLIPIDICECWELYKRSIKKHNSSILLSKKQHCFMANQLIMAGGKIAKYTLESGSYGYIMYLPADEQGILRIYESDLTISKIELLARLLAKKEKFRSVEWKYPGRVKENCTKSEAFVMWKPLTKEGAVNEIKAGQILQ